MKKKVLATLMAAALAVTSLAACGNTAAETDNGAEETAVELKDITIAVPFADSGVTSLDQFGASCHQLEAVSNSNVIFSPNDFTPDAMISFVESQIAAGVDGLIVMPASDSILPTIASLCEEAGVYWAITFRSISDPDIKEMVESSKYYVGNCYEDEYQAGYTCGQWMGEQGYKKIAIISQTKGDTTCDTRELGLAQACEEYGMEIVAESRGHVQASDTTAAVESFLAANDDLDAIFFVGSSVTGAHEAAIKALQDQQREEVKVVSVDFPAEMEADFETGIYVYGYACVAGAFDPFLTLIKVVNAAQGYQIEGSDGNAFSSNYMSMSAVASTEEAAAYKQAAGAADYLYFTDEDLGQLLKWNNPSLDEASLQEILNNYEVHE